MSGIIHIPWYATTFHGDQLADALAEIAPVAMRYNACFYEVLRSKDDRYRIIQTALFDTKLDFERYWEGPEFREMREECSALYQVPVLYEWYDLVESAHRADAPDSTLA